MVALTIQLQSKIEQRVIDEIMTDSKKEIVEKSIKLVNAKVLYSSLRQKRLGVLYLALKAHYAEVILKR